MILDDEEDYPHTYLSSQNEFVQTNIGTVLKMSLKPCRLASLSYLLFGKATVITVITELHTPQSATASAVLPCG